MNIQWSQYNNLVLLLLRLAFGLSMFLFHGWGKCEKLLSGGPISFLDPIGWGSTISLGMTVFAEGLCAMLIAIGLLTRWATLPLIITMAVAVFVIHAGDPWGDRELGLLYMVSYLAIAVLGPGTYSVDHMLKSRR